MGSRGTQLTCWSNVHGRDFLWGVNQQTECFVEPLLEILCAERSGRDVCADTYAYVYICTHAYLTVRACVSLHRVYSKLCCFVAGVHLPLVADRTGPRRVCYTRSVGASRRICDERLECGNGARHLAQSVRFVCSDVEVTVGQTVTVLSSGLRPRSVSKNVVILCSKVSLVCPACGIWLLGWDVPVGSQRRFL